jgi:hypothetical protein
MIGAKKLTWKTWCQSLKDVVAAPSRAPLGPFGRDAGIVDQRVELAALGGQSLLDLGDAAHRVLGVAEIDLDVISGARRPGAFVGKDLARAGQDAPARHGELHHGGVADATAGAGQQHDRALAGLGLGKIEFWHRHGDYPQG